VQNVVHESHSHFVADLLTGGDQGNTQNGSLTVLFLLQALMHHILDLEHVSATNIGDTGDHDFKEFFDRMLDHADGVQSSLALGLLAHVEECETDTEVFSGGLVELVLASFHQGLDDGTCHFLITLTDEGQTKR